MGDWTFPAQAEGLHGRICFQAVWVIWAHIRAALHREMFGGFKTLYLLLIFYSGVGGGMVLLVKSISDLLLLNMLSVMLLLIAFDSFDMSL